jgi:hypothetical protein
MEAQAKAWLRAKTSRIKVGSTGPQSSANSADFGQRGLPAIQDKPLMKFDWDTIPAAAGMRAGSSRKGVCGDKMSAVLVSKASDAVFDRKTHWHEDALA